MRRTLPELACTEQLCYLKQSVQPAPTIIWILTLLIHSLEARRKMQKDHDGNLTDLLITSLELAKKRLVALHTETWAKFF